MSYRLQNYHNLSTLQDALEVLRDKASLVYLVVRAYNDNYKVNVGGGYTTSYPSKRSGWLYRASLL